MKIAICLRMQKNRKLQVPVCSCFWSLSINTTHFLLVTKSINLLVKQFIFSLLDNSVVHY